FSRTAVQRIAPQVVNSLFTYRVDNHFSVSTEMQSARMTRIVIQDSNVFPGFQIDKGNVWLAHFEIIGTYKQRFTIWREIEKTHALRFVQELRCASIHG